MNRLIARFWPSVALTLIALTILVLEYRAAPVDQRLMPVAFQNPFFVAAGKWGIRFLTISLAVTPIYALSGWRFPIKLRKPAGLLAFMFVTVHASVYILNGGYYNPQFGFLRRLVEPQFVIYGLAAFIILLLMAITSVKPTTKLMGRYWKPLHRLVYAASMLMMLHSIMTATSGKRAAYGGPESAVELAIYLTILIVLLILRIPPVKRRAKHILSNLGNPRRGASQGRQTA